MSGDSLRETVISGRLPESWTARYLDVVGSTQDEARAAARSGAPTRSLFVADFQTRGRGRQGREWQSARGSALMLSVLFRDSSAAPQPLRYTTLFSVALAEAIEKLLPELTVQVKWPNDLLIGRWKVAGILAEAATNRGRLSIIVGAGTNVSAVPSAAVDTATCLADEANRRVDRGELLLLLVEQLDRWLQRDLADLHSAWRGRLWGVGQVVRLRTLAPESESEREVVVLGAHEDGSLLVRLPDGTEETTATAELIL